MTIFYDFYKYDIEIVIGSMLITTNLKHGQYGLCDVLTITASEGNPRTANFSFIPPEAIIDLGKLQGQAVSIFIRDNTAWHQVFSGTVLVPILDFFNRKVSLQCTDNRANRIINLEPSYVQTIGYYDKGVFGAAIDQTDELNKRLQTVNAAFDFDGYGNPQLTSWTPKGSPDFTFTSADVRQGSKPGIKYATRDKTVNTVTITVNYNYVRQHQQAANFTWAGFNNFITDYWNQGTPSFPTRTQVNTAATGSNWKIVNPNAVIELAAIWPAGFYQGIEWQPNKVTYTYQGRTQFTGYLQSTDPTTGIKSPVTVGNPPQLVPQYSPVLDSNGKQIMDETSETIEDTSSALCRGASWTSALRFSQDITETYTIDVYSTQSIAKFGSVPSTSIINITDPTDTAQWDASKTVTQVFDNFYIDQKPGYSNLVNSLQTAYYKARHDILAAHRDVTVSFQTYIKPAIDLQHTIDFSVEDPKSNTAHIYATGKVGSFSHTIDFVHEVAYTDINLLLSRADGSETDDEPLINVPEQDPGYIGTPPNITLGTHLGMNPDPTVTPGADKWTGWIGNRTIPGTALAGAYRTTFTESFVVEFPAIPDAVRNKQTYTASTGLNIAIPNDYLEDGL